MVALPVEDAADAPRRERGRVGRPPIEESIELLMPSQFRTPAHESWWPGEKRLMLAVLTDAVEILAIGPAANGPRRRALYEETVAWVASDDTQWPFSFVNVCDALDLSASRVRSVIDELSSPVRRAPAPPLEPLRWEIAPRYEVAG